MKIKTLIAILLWTTFCCPSLVRAQMDSGVPNLAKFEGKNKVRQTVVYIDQAMMREGDTTWADRIDTKLSASLMPAERVTVVRLDTFNGVAEEMWSGCWPAYTPAELKQIENRGTMTSFFSEDPLKKLPEEQAFFRRLVGGALGKIYAQGKAAPSRGKKNLLLALGADEDRFQNSGLMTRVILYSDMNAPTDGDKLSLDFANAVIYCFGVDSKQRAARNDWSKAFLRAHALIASFSSDLGITGGSPAAVYQYNLEFSTTKSNFLGDMVLLVSSDGRLQDSYLSIKSTNPPRASLLTGVFKKDEHNLVKLVANTEMGLATDEPNELIELSGHDTLNGQIGHAEFDLVGTNKPAVFELTAYPK